MKVIIEKRKNKNLVQPVNPLLLKGQQDAPGDLMPQGIHGDGVEVGTSVVEESEWVELK